MAIYDPYNRQEIGTWLYSHIHTLLNNAKHFHDSSMVIYACFETRNFLEKLEFYIIMAALTEEERYKYLPEVEKMWGLASAFGNFIQERAYIYITFINALHKAKSLPFRPLGRFDFKASNRFKLQLNKYCHLYTKLQPDLEFNSQFIQNGLQLPLRVFEDLVSRKVLDLEHGITIVGTSINEFKGDTLVILNR